VKYKCLVLDHDDTVVNSTASIHFPSFVKYLEEYRPEIAGNYTLNDYLEKNFHPGIISLFRDEVGLSEEEMKEEELYWKEFVKNHIPEAYEGIREIISEFTDRGGIVAVASHSFESYIRRDYLHNGLVMPTLIYGWDLDADKRKPSPFAIEDICSRFGLSASEILVVDDLKPGYDMARGGGADFAAAGWGYEVESIERFMRANCDYYLKSVDELRELLFG
jgi:phosphoglycolate phosphatase/pyrophosphatase PpaX